MSTYFCSFVTHTSPLTPTTGSVWCQLSRKRQFKCDVLILVLHKTYKDVHMFFSVLLLVTLATLTAAILRMSTVRVKEKINKNQPKCYTLVTLFTELN